MKKVSISPGLLTLIVLAPVYGFALANEFENPPVIPVADLLPPEMISGDNYSVRTEVPTDGFLTRAVIDSEFGEFTAIGPGMLEIRIHEIDALSKLKMLEESEEFQRGAGESFDEKMAGLKQIAASPKETAAGIGQGVNRFFKRVSRSAKTGVQKAGDMLNEQAPGVVEEGGGSSLPGAYSGGTDSDDGESKYTKAAKASGSAAIDILGFEDSRRRLAKRLAVDPYTTNIVLSEMLDEVTKSIFAGDFAVDFATSLIPGAILVSASTLASDWVWDTPPGDLRVAIDNRLLAMGVSQADIDRLLRHRWYPLSYQAEFTASLELMSGVEGIPEIMPLALSVTSFGQARFVVNTIRMYAQYHTEVQAISALQIWGTIVALDSGEKAVIAAPVDYLSWTETMDSFSSRPEFQDYRPTLHIAGKFTARSESELESRGWTLLADSPLLEVQMPVVE